MTMSPAASPTTTDRGRGADVRFPFPPALFAVPLVAALLADRAWPLPLDGGPVVTGVGVALTVGGVAFSLSGAATVLRHRTTVVPHRPVATVVTSGPFRVSRNPMYAGHAVALVGAALWVGSWWPLAADLLAVALTQRLVIAPEETYLAGRFGEEYARYRARVRRWLRASPRCWAGHRAVGHHGRVGRRSSGRVTQRVGPAEPADLRSRPGRAALAVATPEGPVCVPVQVRTSAGQLPVGVDPAAVPPGARPEHGTLLLDDGWYWFQLRAVVRRGRLAPVAGPAGTLHWYAFDARTEVAWDYGTLHREDER